MKIIDIVNRDSVNLTNCESEPIHVPGTIQPHGFLLGISDDFIIRYCSNNIATLFNREPAALLGQALAAFVSPADHAAFVQYVPTLPLLPQPFVFTLDEVPYNTTVHTSGSVILLEFEAFPDGSLALPDLYAQTRKFVAMIEQVSSVQELCQAVATETRSITGYDRVMIYRFDQQYNGEIIAESRQESLEPFLGLHYPHTDIPAQARELYLRNQLRIIVDVNYTPVPLLTTEHYGDQQLDLSLSVLRSVSPIHIEYLKNMGVHATMNISLIHNKRLWGLIACHHYSEKHVPHYTRLAAKLQGHFLTSQLDVRQVVEEHDLERQVNKGLSGLLQHLSEDSGFVAQLSADPALYHFIHAGGVTLLHNGHCYRSGHLPEEDAVSALAAWLDTHAGTELVTDSLKETGYPGWAAITALSSGIVYYRLNPKEQDCIIWFRPEVETTIDWAGNPDKAVVQEAGQTKLSPRKSFELWKEIVSAKSREWKLPEIQAALKLAQALEKQLLFDNLAQEEDKQRRLAEQLRAANSELRNINWISTHDLREPLRKIQLFGSKIADQYYDELQDGVKTSLDKIRQTAKRMQQLLDDILKYSMISGDPASREATDLNEVFRAISEELADELNDKQASLHCDPLPTITGIPFQLRQLFLNLVHNALKFSREGIAPVIRVSYSLADNPSEELSYLNKGPWHKICVQDNGIGFDNRYAEKIMGIFQRLHGSSVYSGTGIGLAISRKIAENHQGLLLASGIPDEGACFCLWLPA